MPREKMRPDWRAQVEDCRSKYSHCSPSSQSFPGRFSYFITSNLRPGSYNQVWYFSKPARREKDYHLIQSSGKKGEIDRLAVGPLHGMVQLHPFDGDF